jgi:transposase
MTVDLWALCDWLAEAGIIQVAMESTGEYWKPVCNLLAGNCEVCVVNAAPVKQVPGRKPDKAAARWLANRMRDGLLKASFMPPQGQRDLRDLTRYRAQVVQERSRESDRGQGVLERANSKPAAVATDIRGVSGRALRAAVVEGRADPATMAALAKGRMRSKSPVLEQALTGLMRDPHRRLLVLQWAHIDVLDEQIETRNAEITRGLMALDPAAPPALPPTTGEGAAHPASPLPPLTYERAITLVDTRPGGDRRGAEVWVAETGIDMARFGTAARLAAWAGGAPGHDASAGQQRSGRTCPGDQGLRAMLTQLAHAAARTKGTYLSALYHRLAARRGKKRAIVAVAHAMVVSAFSRLVRHEPSHALGANDVDEHRRPAVVDRLMRRIQHLGYRVHLEPLSTSMA